jgi:hypothetical protein
MTGSPDQGFPCIGMSSYHLVLLSSDTATRPGTRGAAGRAAQAETAVEGARQARSGSRGWDKSGSDEAEESTVRAETKTTPAAQTRKCRNPSTHPCPEAQAD